MVNNDWQLQTKLSKHGKQYEHGFVVDKCKTILFWEGLSTWKFPGLAYSPSLFLHTKTELL